MEKFVRKIVSMMKDEGLYAWQGGPIILSQVIFFFFFHIFTWFLSNDSVQTAHCLLLLSMACSA